MPPVFAMAQAAGTAAAICVKDNCRPEEGDILKLQQILREQGQCLEV